MIIPTTRSSLLALVLALGATAAAQTPNPAPRTPNPEPRTANARTPSRMTSEQAVLKADDDRFDAMLKGDVDALERMLAPELMFVHASARIDDKHSLLYNIKSGQLKYFTITPTERRVHVMGNVAVITGITTVHVIDHGLDVDASLRYINVHVLRDGRWQMVNWQATRIVPSSQVIPGGPA